MKGGNIRGLIRADLRTTLFCVSVMKFLRSFGNFSISFFFNSEWLLSLKVVLSNL